MARTGQSIILLVLALAQIATARLTDWLGIGQSVAAQSAATAHPLVPAGPAFAIWGVIYLYSLIAAIWQILPAQRDNAALKAVGWNIAAVWLVNALWQIWVPLMGLDWVSAAAVALAVVAGLTGLMRLNSGPRLPRQSRWLVFGPLALVTGWITAAMAVNITSAMVLTGLGPDPRQIMVSVVALLVLIGFGGAMVYRTGSTLYALALVWALFWILIANQGAHYNPIMLTISALGMALVLLVRALTYPRRRAVAAEA